MKTRNMVIRIGAVVTLVGVLVVLLHLVDFTREEWCQVTNSVSSVEGKRMVVVRDEKGSLHQAFLFNDDGHKYQPGDSVLVDFPMGPSYIIDRSSTIDRCIFDYPTILIIGVMVLAAGMMIRGQEGVDRDAA